MHGIRDLTIRPACVPSARAQAAEAEVCKTAARLGVFAGGMSPLRAEDFVSCVAANYFGTPGCNATQKTRPFAA
jgi:hypothetical protein